MPRILIVDDEHENRKALLMALGDENEAWILLEASGYAEAKAIIEKQLAQKEPIDVLLTDLVMESDQSGMALLQEARRLDPNIMAIMFTAKEKSLDRYKAFDLGAFDVVEKNMRGASAVREMNIKTRAAIKYREWSQRISFLGRYFDPKLFELIEKQPSLLTMQSRPITICFWDIRGFSLLCEILKAQPTLISGFLKEYCDTAATTIFKYGGVLDKFIGDGVMALFGVFSPPGDDGTKEAAMAAVKAACEFNHRFASVVSTWSQKWQLYTPQSIEIGLGCGIHTGEALVGNIGTDYRDQFTALGPHVNFTSRIEGRSKSGQILVSQSTEARIRNTVPLDFELELTDIKNITGKFKIFSVSEDAQRILISVVR
jgi:adenylate cyclase